MICAACGRQGEDEARTCAVCGSSPLLEGRYQLLDVLGQRSGGTTYRARQMDTERLVVVKELSLRATASLKEVELFEREAQLLEELVHPAIPRFLAHFEVRRGKTISLYIVQELVVGQSLESTLQESRWTAREIASLMADVCEVLGYLKDAHVVHRDLKPSNLLRRENGELVLVDFGAARVVAETLHRGGSTVTGTFGYMAPEQMVGEATPATDVFGLGATGLRLLTGREPHELWSASGGFEYDREQFDPGIVGAIDAMTALHAEDRPEVGTLAGALRNFADGEPRALTTYARETAIVSRGDSIMRPPTRTAWAGLGDAVKGALWSQLLVGLFVLYASLALAESTAALIGFALLASALASIPLFIALFRGALRALLFKRGAGVRGVVLARDVIGAGTGSLYVRRKLLVSYRYQIGAAQFEEQCTVPEEVFVGTDPGDEVAVWYWPDKPHDSAVSLIEDPRRLLE